VRTAKRHRMAAAAACSAALIAAAPLAAGGTKHKDPPGKGKDPGREQPKKPSPQYGFKGKAKKATLFARLLGKNEIGPTGKRRAGDPDGQGGATLTLTQGGQLCFGIVVQGISAPTAAHVHVGRRNVNGDIVITLAPPTGGDPGASSGCVAVDQNLLMKIRKHPRRYYVNVHTGDFQGGAVRGQLHKAPWM
jgi:CHRD domain